MEWTQEHIESIRHLFPKQRGHVAIDYLRFFQALHYIDKNGCTWRDLPEKFGNWNSIYIRFRYWIDIGSFDRIEAPLMRHAIDIQGIKALALDSTYVKVHPDGTGAPKKTASNLSARVALVGQQRFMRSYR
jgi:transposase